ncbi:MAG: hypothetical protein PHP01_01380 [Phycisphaerae bacterium]|nr:hypothetical protein [Phycisphaerae bacterium]
MTITFNCPKCGFVCAFKDVYAGRRARCLKCDQVFIIPAGDNQKAEKVKPPKENEDPLGGFYEAVFKNTLSAIFNKQGIATLVFVLLVTALRFFTIHLDFSVSIRSAYGEGFSIHIPIGWAAAFFIWGGLFWVYAEIIYSTAFDVEFLPEIIFEGGGGYVLKVLGSIYAFIVALLVSLLPAIAARLVFGWFGINSRWAVLLFVVLGLFLFPMAVLTVSIGRDLTMLFRFDYFFGPIKRAFGHYLFIVVFLIVVWQLQYMSNNYGDIKGRPVSIIFLNLFFVLAIQILAITAMRIMGLFYRHFACYFKW